MNNLFKGLPYYQTKSELLILDDAFCALKKIKPDSIDMIFADPPYFLSNDGITCSSGKMVSVNKGNWDKTLDKHKFNRRWIKLCEKALKPNGLYGQVVHFIIFTVLAWRWNKKGLRFLTILLGKKPIHHPT